MLLIVACRIFLFFFWGPFVGCGSLFAVRSLFFVCRRIVVVWSLVLFVVVCCPLCAMCRLLFVCCCLLCVVYSLLLVGRRPLFVVGCLLIVVRCVVWRPMIGS